MHVRACLNLALLQYILYCKLFLQFKRIIHGALLLEFHLRPHIKNLSMKIKIYEYIAFFQKVTD